jgi:hypothetical protein
VRQVKNEHAENAVFSAELKTLLEASENPTTTNRAPERPVATMENPLPYAFD